jgi:hypothetical protein
VERGVGSNLLFFPRATPGTLLVYINNLNGSFVILKGVRHIICGAENSIAN